MFKNNIFKVGSLTALAAAFLMGDSGTAHAQAATLGDILTNLGTNAKPFANIFEWVAYLGGAVFTVQGIHQFRGHTESPQNHKLSTAIMLWVGAMGLLALPSFVGMIVSTLGYGSGSAASIAAVSCSGGSGLDGMMCNFVTNIQKPLGSFVSIVAILCGLFMIVRGLFKASKYGFDPKTNSINSILSNIIFGALLTTIGSNLGMMMASVFGNATISSTVLNWNLPGGVSPQFTAAASAALAFVQLIGVIAFVRGWLVLKKVVEGGGNATMAQGLSHIIGGVLAINIGAFLRAVDTTFGTGLLS